MERLIDVYLRVNREIVRLLVKMDKIGMVPERKEYGRIVKNLESCLRLIILSMQEYLPIHDSDLRSKFHDLVLHNPYYIVNGIGKDKKIRYWTGTIDGWSKDFSKAHAFSEKRLVGYAFKRQEKGQKEKGRIDQFRFFNAVAMTKLQLRLLKNGG